jgi:hypothetical protein
MFCVFHKKYLPEITVWQIAIPTEKVVFPYYDALFYVFDNIPNTME